MIPPEVHLARLKIHKETKGMSEEGTMANNKVEKINTEEITKEIKQCASQSANEEELKIKVEYLLRTRVLDSWQIPWASYEHRTLVSGVRKDALYGTVIIEYKAPCKLSDKNQFENFKAKVKQYIAEEARDERFYNRYFGVLLDGEKIAFIRFRKGEWEEPEKPLDINRYTILRLLEAIRGLTRKPVDAEFLLQDFGPKSTISKACIISLYQALRKSKSPRTKMLFEDWRTVFSQICAYSTEKLKGLIKYYEIEEESPDVEKILFSVHTYYTLLMKLLTSEIVTLFADSVIGSYLKKVEEAYYRGSHEMRQELGELEEGGLFYTLGIKNFLEADYFAWYLDDWNDEIAHSISEIVKKLMDYEPATVELNPERVKDLFKRLYQNLVPRDVRHKLGEYFTPDWLADLLLDEIEYDGDPEKSVLDPACGSGTFLVLAIKKIKDYAEKHFLDKRDILKKIIERIKGIDLNPLAVLAAKANYLIALSDMLRYRPKEGIEIPVYLADSIFVGRKEAGQSELEVQRRIVFDKSAQKEWEAYITTNEGQFWMPMEVIDKGRLSSVLDLINGCIRNKYSENEFEKRLKNTFHFRPYAYGALKRLYKKLIGLERYNKNKIWTRLLKNRFAPLFIGKFDFVVGNPPWINWENLPEYHRNQTKPLWDYYGLLEKTKGKGLGKVKRDLAMLFVARCFDRYVKENGILSFLVPWTLFKTQAGAGFRKLLSKGFTHRWGKTKEVPIETIKVHDLVQLYPFEGAVNRTALIAIKKGETKFPIPCQMWSNPRKENIPMEEELENVRKRTKQNEMILTPIVEKDTMAPWMIISEKAYKAVKKVIGESEYEAYEGVNTALNGVYWLEILRKHPDGLLVKNTQLAGYKKKVKEVTEILEPDLIYPLIRGEDVKKWHGEPSRYILVPHNPSTGKAIDESAIKINYPKTYKFLFGLKEELANRSIHKLWGKNSPFYAVYDIGNYTFAPYKVMWKRIAGGITGKAVSFASCVITTVKDKFFEVEKPVIPNDSLILIPLNSKDEAFYICSVLNSSPVLFAIASYTYELRMETHITKYINIPRFKSQKPLCSEISQLSMQAHELAKEGKTEEIKEIEEQIDQKVAELYGITDEELAEIKKCLQLLKEGEVETEEETEEEVIPEAPKGIGITVNPLLIYEDIAEQITLEIQNNFDDTVEEISVEILLTGNKIAKQSLNRLKFKSKSLLNFILPPLKGGEYKLKMNLTYKLNEEKQVMQVEKNLFVQREKAKESPGSGWDESFERFLEEEK